MTSFQAVFSLVFDFIIYDFLSIKSSSYPDFNRKALYCINVSLNNWSSLTLSEQFVRHRFTTITGIFSAMCFGWQNLGDKYWCVSVFSNT